MSGEVAALEREAARMLSRARARLVLTDPFFGVLSLETEGEASEEVPTAGVTEDDRILYCPAWWLDLVDDERVGTLAHEVVHMALGVFPRRAWRDGPKWNVAHDYVVNLILADPATPGGPRFRLPKGALLDVRYRGLSGEQVYDLLPDPPKKGGGVGGSAPGGGSAPKFGWGTANGCADHDGAARRAAGKPAGKGSDGGALRWKRRIATAAEAARRVGRFPADLEELVGEILRPRLPWEQVLRRFVADSCSEPDDVSWARPSRRDAALGIRLPSDEPRPEPVVVAIDASGSMLGPPLDRAVAETAAILAQFPGTPVRVLVVDAKVQSDVSVLDAVAVRKAVKGGGGTDFSDLFALLRKGPPPRALVFLTDLFATGIPAAPPPFPVLWVCPPSHGKAPWGTVLEVRD